MAKLDIRIVGVKKESGLESVVKTFNASSFYGLNI